MHDHWCKSKKRISDGHGQADVRACINSETRAC
jgi:hypothetical protein